MFTENEIQRSLYILADIWLSRPFCTIFCSKVWNIKNMRFPRVEVNMSNLKLFLNIFFSIFFMVAIAWSDSFRLVVLKKL